MVHTGITEDEFLAYVATLDANDALTLYANNSVTNTTKKNYSYTYYTENDVLALDYSTATKELRITWEARSNTYLPMSNNYVALSGCTSTITELGLGDAYDEDPGNGMAYVIRLADGSFIVIDGGHNPAAASQLYNVLLKQAAEVGISKPVIAAWIFTHSHSDHTAFFANFARNYGKNVEIECFIFNFPNENMISHSSDKVIELLYGSGHTNWDDEKNPINAVYDPLVRYFPTVPRINAHTGQVFNFRNASIKILYTLEAAYEGSSQFVTYYNDTSMVFTVEMEGVKTMYLGDAGENTAKILTERYDDSVFKSDVIQVAHHGIGSSPSALYPLIDADYVLWPMGDGSPTSTEKYEKYLTASHNAYFFNGMTQSEANLDANNIYIAQNKITILTLSSGNVTPTCKPSERPTVGAYLAG